MKLECRAVHLTIYICVLSQVIAEPQTGEPMVLWELSGPQIWSLRPPEDMWATAQVSVLMCDVITY